MKALAAELFTDERRAQLAAAIDELAVLARDLPQTREAALFLAADVDLAWRLLALALVAEELGDDESLRGIARASTLPIRASSQALRRRSRGFSCARMVLRARRRGRCGCGSARGRVPADRSKCDQRQADRQREGRGAAHLPEGGQDQARAGVGGGRRHRAHRRRALRRSSVSTTAAAGRSTTSTIRR